jgi:uncharacterized protein (TIGR02266 family)
MKLRPRKPEQRFRRRLEVRYAKPGSAPQLGYSGNISNTGMMIRTPNVLPPGTVLELELRLPQGSITLMGRVAWARTGPLTWLATGRIGMGVRFIDPPADLVGRLRVVTAARAS